MDELIKLTRFASDLISKNSRSLFCRALESESGHVLCRLECLSDVYAIAVIACAIFY